MYYGNLQYSGLILKSTFVNNSAGAHPRVIRVCICSFRPRWAPRPTVYS